jgi:hypothetical protein
MTMRSQPAMLLLLVAGFAIWSSSFIALYGVFSLGCALGWERVVFGPLSLNRLVLLLIWLLHIAAIVLLLFWTARRATLLRTENGSASDFLLWAGWGAMVSALAATIWTGAPILLTSMCL